MSAPTFENEWRQPAGAIGLFVAGVIVTIGTAWAFERGGQDFAVFFRAWKLVLEGHGGLIYRDSPDRFLYAPGFAWCLAPLAWLPSELALALWCFFKAAVVGLTVRELQPAAGRFGLAGFGMAAWGVALVARPLLIDFQYGQVNTLILGISLWALSRHFLRPSRGHVADFLAWFALAGAGVSKLVPLPFLILPWLAIERQSVRKLRLERAGVVAGVLLLLLSPIVTEGFAGCRELYSGWWQALQAKGLPYESHNQSFSALLHRWFSGEPVHVVGLGMFPVKMGWRLLGEREIRLLSLAWVSISSGILATWLFCRRPGGLAPVEPRRWVVIACALLVLPSYLIWKPYFVLFLPLAALLAADGVRRLWLLAIAFIAMNLTGFDLLGADWGARVEAASAMLWAALALFACLPRAQSSQSRA